MEYIHVLSSRNIHLCEVRLLLILNSIVPPSVGEQICSHNHALMALVYPQICHYQKVGNDFERWKRGYFDTA